MKVINDVLHWCESHQSTVCICISGCCFLNCFSSACRDGLTFARISGFIRSWNSTPCKLVDFSHGETTDIIQLNKLEDAGHLQMVILMLEDPGLPAQKLDFELGAFQILCLYLHQSWPLQGPQKPSDDSEVLGLRS